MSKHTPTPWSNFEKDTYGFNSIVSISEKHNGGDIICEAPQEWKSSMVNWEANALRIVTCVNAMEGLTNEEVEQLRSKPDASQVAVAFAEWKDGERFLYCYMGEGVYKYIHAKLGAFLPNDLYKHWIKNVYKT